ncbi:MAG: ABC transporter ATP-binding protein [Verrucomicrobia bacterium]|nr:ABC transporter ATP-binding protein [Verrucomicrobiota bacterium]MCG2678361.1 ABC transporter ATP-binding protein [Kiritimatiellia bacterium]MBU4247342.1 ABC transporter ATP-binding protein [Verrucomicrobiota bacterium]MBU4291467.1 ABC transporter ATP-binding protein [Verrucomicrobiota bacterium]MBU4428731.1 ABC transporter ATP-binding protein [Verrucomicrobiota bacterium]
MKMPLLEVENLRVTFGSPQQPVRAVDGISFSMQRGESVGLVGESGCGKSTTGRAILRLVPIQAGAIRMEGQDIGALKGRALKAFRRKAQMVFQDPFGSLNPKMTVGAALEEPLEIHFRMPANERRARVAELLKSVELDPGAARRYPHEFSGGQRQRIGIARALALDPALVIADEPVSALDVSVQAQILNLLKIICCQRQCALLLIAHDLAVVRYMCARVLVMYRGRIMEAGPVGDFFLHPAHPYTEALLAAVPDVRKRLVGRLPADARAALKGDVPAVTGNTTGCPLQARCPRTVPRCRKEYPALREVKPGRKSACHFATEMLQADQKINR